MLESDRSGPRAQNDRAVTGTGGAFRFDQLDPDCTLSLWARTNIAATNGAVTVKPGDDRGKVTLTIDPNFASQVRGMATDGAGKRISGASVRLWWGRPYAADFGGEPDQVDPTILESYVTSAGGWFVFRGLWPGFQYGVEIDAPGHTKAEAHTVIADQEKFHDVGKIVLARTSGALAGRVVGSRGEPIAGAVVFNRGDGPEIVTTLTNSDGQFQLSSLMPGTKYTFVRNDGYRFTGVKADDDARALLITVRRNGEPPPAWKPTATASFDEQRAFAKQILIRLWEKFAAKAEGGSAPYIAAMAPINAPLASTWSAAKGHRYDRVLRQTAAEKMAETDAQGTVAFLAQDRDRQTQAFFQHLAQRFAAGHDRAKALLFADEAVNRARVLPEDERAAPLATAGALLARAGKAEAGRALVDEAALAAAQLGTVDRAARDRAIVAGALAPYGLKRRWRSSNQSKTAIRIALTHTSPARSQRPTPIGLSPWQTSWAGLRPHERRANRDRLQDRRGQS